MRAPSKQSIIYKGKKFLELMSFEQEILSILEERKVPKSILSKATKDDIVLFSILHNDEEKSYDALFNGKTGTHAVRVFFNGEIFCSCFYFKRHRTIDKHIVKLCLLIGSPALARIVRVEPHNV